MIGRSMLSAGPCLSQSIGFSRKSDYFASWRPRRDIPDLGESTVVMDIEAGPATGAFTHDRPFRPAANPVVTGQTRTISGSAKTPGRYLDIDWPMVERTRVLNQGTMAWEFVKYPRLCCYLTCQQKIPVLRRVAGPNDASYALVALYLERSDKGFLQMRIA